MTSSPLQLLVFDCDGVLLDSELISCRCAAEELQRLGMPITTGQVLQRFLGTARAKMATMAREEGYAVPADFVARLEQRIHDVFETELQPVEGVDLLLKQLACPVCVASSSSLPYLYKGLGLTGLLPFFEPHIFSASMVSRPKPAPDLFLFAANQRHATPDRCLVIEDSLAGVAAARAAGMRVLGFLGGSHLDAEREHARYRDAGCEQVVDSMQAVTAYIATLDPHAIRPQSAETQPLTAQSA